MWLLIGVGLAMAQAGDEVSSALVELERAGLEAVESPFEAPSGRVVLTGGTVMTATGEVYQPGFVLFDEGRIVDVGPGDGPSNAVDSVVDVSGQVVTPGLIDTHSHLGVYPSPGAKAHRDGNEATSPTTPGVWAEHSTWPQDPGIQRAVAGGVTSMQILPGSANLIGGRGVVVRAIPHRGSRAMRFPGAPETVKMACGENPKRVYGDKSGPSTRMGNLRGQRQAFLDAQDYQRAWDKHAKKSDKKKKDGEPDKSPKRDLDMETLVGVMDGRILPQIHCYRADDMLSMIQLSDEFGFQIRSFHHALEAYKIRDVLADRGIAASTWADWWGFKVEAYDGIQENAAMLADAGGRTIIHSDSGIGIQRLNQEASKAAWAGRHAGYDVSDDEALRWITVNPAWALGIDHEVGTLEAGKRADLVIWDADPFSVYASARYVFVDGHLVHDSERDVTWSDFELGQEVNR